MVARVMESLQQAARIAAYAETSGMISPACECAVENMVHDAEGFMRADLERP